MENDNDTGVLIFVAIVALLTVLGGLYLAFNDGAEPDIVVPVEAVTE